MSRQTILDLLKGGDRRSIGRSNQVVARLRRCPLLFPVLIDGMHHPDELVRMRAADAAEKRTVDHPQVASAFQTAADEDGCLYDTTGAPMVSRSDAPTIWSCRGRNGLRL